MAVAYILPGIEVDSRIYDLLEIPNHTKKVIQWVPMDKGDTLSTYAKKLMDQIDDEQAILLGFSYGGAVAIELAQLKSFKHVIVVSAIKSKQELPGWIRFSARISLDKIVPASFYSGSNWLKNKLLGVKSSNKKKLGELQLPTKNFHKRALSILLRWKHSHNLENIIHVHGEKDKIIPIRNVKGCHPIKDGGHLFFAYKVRKLNTFLTELLSK